MIGNGFDLNLYWWKKRSILTPYMHHKFIGSCARKNINSLQKQNAHCFSKTHKINALKPETFAFESLFPDIEPAVRKSYHCDFYRNDCFDLSLENPLVFVS